MPLSTRRALMGGSYVDKVLGTGPIAYWPLDEGGGTVARCLVNTAQNGTATGVTWASDATGPFGSPAPFFDGANDYVSLAAGPLAAFNTRFNGETGSLMAWMRVNGVGVWTDALRHGIVTLWCDANNYILTEKHSSNNTMRAIYEAGGVLGVRENAGKSSVAWVHVGMTWSDLSNANQLKVYWNGVQDGATIVGLGNWAGNLIKVVIGSVDTVPLTPWHGWLAHCVVWNRVLGASEIMALANP